MDPEIEVPQYFICPISLHIMKDPVTMATGISYDRESIQKWLNSCSKNDKLCPVTNQVLARDSDLIPNHTLRRLIQAWCNDQNLTPTPNPLNRNVCVLIENLQVPNLFLSTLKEIELLAKENEMERKSLVEAGMEKIMAILITKCCKENSLIGLEEALRILNLIWMPSNKIKLFINDDKKFIDSLIWICSQAEISFQVKTQSMLASQLAIEVASNNLLERLNPDFFNKVVSIVNNEISKSATKSALRVLSQTCLHGGNKIKIVKANGVLELIELELKNTDKSISELVFNLLGELCSCADGRAKFLAHAGSLAMIAKRMLRVSRATDDRAIHMLVLISKFSASNEILSEMLIVGVVAKLCMVVQADCDSYLKQKANWILRSHSNMWKNSPCIYIYLLTRV
ncbi:hypothetical protein ACFE04_017645 [Oxalis oulophora]